MLKASQSYKVMNVVKSDKSKNFLDFLKEEKSRNKDFTSSCKSISIQLNKLKKL